jgi:hypothetical protein
MREDSIDSRETVADVYRPYTVYVHRLHMDMEYSLVPNERLGIHTEGSQGRWKIDRQYGIQRLYGTMP